MILPVFTKALLDIAQIELSIGVEVGISQALECFALNFEAVTRLLHQVDETNPKCCFVTRLQCQARQVNRHHTN